MKTRVLVLSGVALLSTVSAPVSAAEKLSPAFRTAFERSFWRADLIDFKRKNGGRGKD